jgi:hypothetical protein
MSDSPIACSLTSTELQERRRTVLQKVRSAVVEVRELENGYAYSFPSTGDWLGQLTGLIELERQCCPFLRFRLTIEASGGPLWLEMTGPQGTKDFLVDVFKEALNNSIPIYVSQSRGAGGSIKLGVERSETPG